MELSFEPGLSQVHSCLRDVMAAGVYQRGLKRVAGDVDESPSKLSEKLGGGTGDRVRDVGLELFERYLDETHDMRPIYYLVEKYLKDADAARAEKLARVEALLEALPQALAAADLGKSAARHRRGRR